jgi:hypothetical protein
MNSFDKIATPKLLNEEARIEEERRDKMSRITLEVEAILLREDISMGELAQILDLFNARAQKVFSEMKLKNIKETYERCN